MSSFKRWSLPDFAVVPGDAPVLPAPVTMEEAYARGYTNGSNDGYSEGMRDGLRDGAGEGERRFGTACEAVEAAAQALREAHATAVAEIEETLTVLALAVARRIIQREVTADPTVVPDLVRRAVETLTSDTPPTVRLNPDDLATLSDAGRRLEVEWVADHEVERGGFIIETPHRVLDGRLDGMLRNFYEHLRNV